MGGLAVALLLVLIAPPSPRPSDGAAGMGCRAGRLSDGPKARAHAILPFCPTPVGETGLSTIAAGIIGVLLVAGLGLSGNADAAGR